MADTLTVMCSGAFVNALNLLVPPFQHATGCSVRIVAGPSVGNSPRALPGRLRAGEASDLVILFEGAIEALTREKLLLAGTRTRLASSGIGVAVRRGAREPEIGSARSLRDALMAARSFAYSSSASGIYISTKMLLALDVPEEITRRGMRVEGETVGAVVARGGAELGFQQLSELVPVEGITLLGPLPGDLQQQTILAAALPTKARNQAGAHALINHLLSARARKVLLELGLEPANPYA